MISYCTVHFRMDVSTCTVSTVSYDTVRYCTVHTCEIPMKNQSFFDDVEFISHVWPCVGTCQVLKWLTRSSIELHLHIAHQRDALPTSARCAHVAACCVGTPILVDRLTCAAGQPTPPLPGPTRFCQLAVPQLKSDLPALFLCREPLSPCPAYG